MQVIQIDRSLIENGVCLSNKNDGTKVFKINDKQIIKTFLFDVSLNEKIEKKVMGSVKFNFSENFTLPTASIYTEDNQFYGYVTNFVDGNNDSDYYTALKNKKNLLMATKLYMKIEECIKNNPDIVFPDLSNLSNIVVDKAGNPNFIDFDGFQIGDYKSSSISSCVYYDRFLNSSKYCYNNIFSKNLDKLSLIHIYFKLVFGINFEFVESFPIYMPVEQKINTLMKLINLNNSDFKNKLCLLFNNCSENEYLDDLPLEIAENYVLFEAPVKSLNNNTFNQLKKK